jgi:hypothetical protein
VRLGLTEGVELHLFGMAFGIDLWPPAFIVPIGPGRLGFEDRSAHSDFEPQRRRGRRVCLGVALEALSWH